MDTITRGWGTREIGSLSHCRLSDKKDGLPDNGVLLGLTTHQIFHIIWCRRPDSSLSPFDETDPTCCPEAIDLYKEKLAEIEEHIAALENAPETTPCFFHEREEH